MADGFKGFFGYQLENPLDYIGFGQLIGSWSTMRVWREIAQGTETVVQWLDDYALGTTERRLVRLVEDLEPDIIQLCWHFRPDLFDGPHPELPYEFPLVPSTESKVGRRDVVVGASGASDWALVLSPRGAQWLLCLLYTSPSPRD